jgi:hypothetical protein
VLKNGKIAMHLFIRDMKGKDSFGSYVYIFQTSFPRTGLKLHLRLTFNTVRREQHRDMLL